MDPAKTIKSSNRKQMIKIPPQLEVRDTDVVYYFIIITARSSGNLSFEQGRITPA